MTIQKILVATMLLAIPMTAAADAVNYKIDPEHTFPSFEADHLGGLSTWRGKFNKNSGTVTLDKAAGTGTVEVVIDMASADFGLESLNKEAAGASLFDVAKFPQATYQGRLAAFVDGKPTQVIGELTLHGVTLPVVLTIDSFKCMPHPVFNREVCGANALATIKRDAFGMSAGKDYGFSMDVNLRIQIEALEVK
jgi:polyisoprenoid-binding protein YceI